MDELARKTPENDATGVYRPETAEQGICQGSTENIHENMRISLPGDRGRHSDSLAKLQKLRIYYKESGQHVKAMAVTSAIEAIR